MRVVKIFFAPWDTIDVPELKEDYDEYQEMTITSFVLRHFVTSDPDYVGLNKKLKMIELHNVIYCDRTRIEKGQTKITDWLTNPNVNKLSTTNLFKSPPSATASGGSIDPPHNNESPELRLSRFPSWIRNLFPDEDTLLKVAESLAFFPSREDYCIACGRNGYEPHLAARRRNAGLMRL
ncbi:uncharacterized protein I206_102154 [Kwoniella pini CBS 10737]|uniref:Uncharacterized protein n=1 Tax=Kwoniella pini CBS 10737 TaxID=1296096 RepID=A0A1B9HUP2_9TREE|nr:uncharacterized protein I206_06752 [Kwoniella pini CBS 10737]OCF46978.1 hypothetical protein I206_06752 [Kwoniella pini CBS 10737]